MIIELILAPGVIGLAYGNVLLGNTKGILFWLHFIVGAVVLLAIATWLIVPLSYIFST
jgi:hypothetical protein